MFADTKRIKIPGCVCRARDSAALPLTSIVSLFLCCMLMACDAANTGSSAAVAKQEMHTAATRAPVRVTDYLGRQVYLPTPATRIVALSPHIVENLYSVGLGEAIVATVSYADYPEAAKKIPRIGGFTNFSIESIIAHQPDLVVGWASGSRDFGRLLDRLEKLGIVVYADDPRTLGDITRSVNDLAVLGGIDPSGQAELALFSNRIKQLREFFLNDRFAFIGNGQC